jgi:putative DNA primase/helicase
MQSVFVTVRAIRNEAALVAASGYPNEHLSERELRELQGWAEAHGVTSRELYLAGDEDGGRLRWIEELEPMDIVLGKGSLWSHKIAAWAKTSEGVGKLNSVATLAKSFADIAIRPEQLDADPMAINVLNGTLRLARDNAKRSSEEIEAGKSEWHCIGWKARLSPHRREDLISKLAPVKYLPGAKCPEYDAFMARVQPDEDMRRFIHQWGGYSLTGETGEQKLAFFYGQGRNGKGTWVETMAHIAGDYAGSIPIESFLDTGGKRRGDQATPDLARLPGVRLLRVSEPEKGSALNEGLIKQVTGGDPVDARHLNKGFFTFMPQFKMTISGNHRPKVKDTSDGIWRRMQLVPWDVQIPKEEVDADLGRRMREKEASGILNRLIEGLIDWKANKLIEPEQVRLATGAYRDASDDVGRFLRDMCEVGGDARKVRCGAKDLHDFYTAWAEQAGAAPYNAKALKNVLTDKGFEQVQSDGIKWTRLRIREGVTIEQVRAGAWTAASDASGMDAAAPDDPEKGCGEPIPGWDD